MWKEEWTKIDYWCEGRGERSKTMTPKLLAWATRHLNPFRTDFLASLVVTMASDAEWTRGEGMVSMALVDWFANLWPVSTGWPWQKLKKYTTLNLFCPMYHPSSSWYGTDGMQKASHYWLRWTINSNIRIRHMIFLKSQRWMMRLCKPFQSISFVFSGPDFWAFGFPTICTNA